MFWGASSDNAFCLLGVKKLKEKKIVGNENEEDFWSDTGDVADCRYDGWL
ncbi:hypothetical protein QUF86_06240 [Peribacillus sp. NJ11]|nr:hypothetical protein [Peribacillus sp. NJ11]MDM5220350.1 hypothetical protein [Peribacillus sp. NJ11]